MATLDAQTAWQLDNPNRLAPGRFCDENILEIGKFRNRSDPSNAFLQNSREKHEIWLEILNLYFPRQIWVKKKSVRWEKCPSDRRTDFLNFLQSRILVACGFDQKMRRLVRWLVDGRASHCVSSFVEMQLSKIWKKKVWREVGFVRPIFFARTDTTTTTTTTTNELLKGCGDQAKRLTRIFWKNYCYIYPISCWQIISKSYCTWIWL
jgi:hypothetical protein